MAPKVTNEMEVKKSTIEEEMAALSGCLKLIGDLDKDAQTRVMRYLRDRLGLYLGTD